MQNLINFLTVNGFTHTKDDKHNFTNKHCHIIVHNKETEWSITHYEVQTFEDYTCSPNLEIYWLIGYLTYYGYMDKDYKIPK